MQRRRSLAMGNASPNWSITGVLRWLAVRIKKVILTSTSLLASRRCQSRWQSDQATGGSFPTPENYDKLGFVLF